MPISVAICFEGQRSHVQAETQRTQSLALVDGVEQRRIVLSSSSRKTHLSGGVSFVGHEVAQTHRLTVIVERCLGTSEFFTARLMMRDFQRELHLVREFLRKSGGRPSSHPSFGSPASIGAMSSTMYAGTWIGCTALMSPV